jgi:hypothetical protein
MRSKRMPKTEPISLGLQTATSFLQNQKTFPILPTVVNSVAQYIM